MQRAAHAAQLPPRAAAAARPPTTRAPRAARVLFFFPARAWRPWPCGGRPAAAARAVVPILAPARARHGGQEGLRAPAAAAPAGRRHPAHVGAAHAAGPGHDGGAAGVRRRRRRREAGRARAVCGAPRQQPRGALARAGGGRVLRRARGLQGAPRGRRRRGHGACVRARAASPAGRRGCRTSARPPRPSGSHVVTLHTDELRAPSRCSWWTSRSTSSTPRASCGAT